MTELCWDFREAIALSPTADRGSAEFEVASFRNPSQFFESSASAIEYEQISLPDTAWSATSHVAAVQAAWEALPARIRNELKQLVAAESVRLGVIGSCAGTQDIAWEWLAEAVFDLPSDRLQVHRVVPTAVAPPPLTVQLPLRILMVASNPKDERVLRASQEVAVLSDGLSQSQYNVETLYTPTVSALESALSRFQPHILHYVGHSGVDRACGAIILHDETSGTNWIAANELAPLLPISVRLLCLSTCISTKNYDVRGLARFAHASASLRLPTLLVNRYEIHEEAARTFWRRFYPSLAQHAGDASAAMADAQQSTRAVNGPDWGSFSLVQRDSGLRPFALTTGFDQERYVNELKAQFSSRVANSIADRVRALGASAPEDLRDHLAEESERFSTFTERLK